MAFLLLHEQVFFDILNKFYFPVCSSQHDKFLTWQPSWLQSWHGSFSDRETTPFSGQFQKCSNDFKTFSNEIQKFTCEFQIFPNEIKIILIMNRAPQRGHQCCQFEYVCHNPKEAHNCLSFWTVFPNVEPCGDNLEQNESSVKLLKQRMRVPQVQPPRVGEQRLAYV